MDQIVLNAEPRTVTGKEVNRLRREGWVPAIIYGPSVGSRPLQIEARQAEAVLGKVGTSHLLSLHIAGEKAPVQVLVRDLQRDPIHRQMVHIDLYQVEMGKPITVEVPLVWVNESPVVVRRDGVLLQGAETVEIECLPGDLIDSIEVDLSLLTEVDQQITVGDLAVPARVRVLSDPAEMIVRVAPSEERAEEEEVAAPPMEGGAEPELVRRRKAEEAEEE
jgi:large subunit ribosomal protein L25